MLRDITIGQYYPVKSRIHELDPRVKLVGVFIFMLSLFMFQSFSGYIVVTAALVTVIGMSHVPVSYVIKGLKPILFLLLFTAVFNVFWTPGIPVFQWKFIVLTDRGLRNGAFMAIRLILLIIGSALLTFTTTPNQLTDAIEKVFAPLKKIKIPVHDFAMMMSLALRFIPILLEEANRIMNAQSARGADFEEGNIFSRVRAMVSILIPLLISATRRAYDLALAMEARCYQGGDTRTKMKPLIYKRWDRYGYVVIGLYLACLFLINHYLWI